MERLPADNSECADSAVHLTSYGMYRAGDTLTRSWPSCHSIKNQIAALGSLSSKEYQTTNGSPVSVNARTVNDPTFSLSKPMRGFAVMV